MALFIPEWTKSGARDVRIKQILSTLDDAFVVRRTIQKIQKIHCPADMFIAHHQKGWMALAVDQTTFEVFNTAQLFKPPAAVEVETRLSELQQLAAIDGHANSAIAALMVMWACTDSEVQMLNKHYIARYGVRLISKSQCTWTCSRNSASSRLFTRARISWMLTRE